MSSVLMPGAVGRSPAVRDERFFFISALVMAGLVVLGFGLNLGLGRSTFAVSARFHVHALLFFSWTSLYVVQSALVNRDALALHRRLGWVAAVLMPAMVVSGILITALNVREGRSPPFFEPVYFLVMNPLHILSVAGLVLAAILMRRRTQWHRRLMYCSMALLVAPAFGRLLPMPFLVPYAGAAVVIPCLILMVVGAVRDFRRGGGVHPAWWWGMGTAAGVVVLIQLVAYSALGLAIYEAVTAGSPSALPPLEFQPIPGF
jgi:uncharacterized membrane protein